jgi:hypothetical protein
MTLLDFYMENYNSSDLKQWVDLCGGSSRLTRKAERAEFLARTLTSAAEVRRLWGEMDELSHKAIAAAYHNEGNFDADAFVAQYGGLPPRPRKDRWSWYGEPILLDLFIQNNTIHGALLPLLAPLVPEPERFQLEGIEAESVTVVLNGEQVPCAIALREEPGRRDLLTLLGMMNQGVLKLGSTSSRLTPKSVELLRQQLVAGDFGDEAAAADDSILCFGLNIFAQQAGLLTSQGKLTDTGSRYLTTEDPALLLDAFEHWSEKGDFDAVTRIEAIRGLRARGIRLTPPAERNQRIVEALSWCPASVWISLLDFYRAVKIWHFDFEIERGGLEKLYVGYSGYNNNYGEWASAQSQWLLTTGLYINAVLWEILAGIGALDIAYMEDAEGVFPAEVYAYDDVIYSRYDGLMYFRINPLGAYLFGQADAYVPSLPVDPGLFSVAADGCIALLPHAPLSAAHHAQLEQIGDPVEGGYQLSVPKLLALLETAPNLDLPRTFLEQRNRGPLPATIIDLLRRVEEDSSALQIQSKALIVRVRSDAVAQAVLNDPTTGKIVRRLDERTFLIPANKETALRNALRVLGYGLRD